MKTKILYPAFVIVIASTIIYYFLGGFNPVKFQIEKESITIYGQLFEGEYDDPELEQYFLKAKELADKNKDNKLIIVDYFIDSKDSVKQFVGITSRDSIALPVLDFSDVTFIKGIITSHHYVRPHPLTVRDLAQDYGTNHALNIEDISIEFYDPKEEIEVWFPARTN